MSLEIARRIEVEMPWTVAAPESWWEVSGTVNAQHHFTDCLARVIPRLYHGENVVMFEVMVFGSPFPVPASAITKGRELIFVEAADPNRAYYQRDQALVDQARRQTLWLEQDSPQAVTYQEAIIEGADPTEGFYDD